MSPLCAHGTQGCGLPLSLGATSCGALPRRCAVVPLWESIRDPWGTDKSVLGSGGGGGGRDAVRGAVLGCRFGVPFYTEAVVLGVTRMNSENPNGCLVSRALV
jgi:hypothetical protein